MTVPMSCLDSSRLSLSDQLLSSIRSAYFENEVYNFVLPPNLIRKKLILHG
jgi:hypothetical protein